MSASPWWISQSPYLTRPRLLYLVLGSILSHALSYFLYLSQLSLTTNSSRVLKLLHDVSLLPFFDGKLPNVLSQVIKVFALPQWETKRGNHTVLNDEKRNYLPWVNYIIRIEYLWGVGSKENLRDFRAVSTSQLPLLLPSTIQETASTVVMWPLTH